MGQVSASEGTPHSVPRRTREAWWGALVCGVACVLAGNLGCARVRTPATKRPPEAQSLPALAASNWLVELPVPGFESAVVAVPRGVRSPRAITIALHGAADRAEWQCGTWFGIAHADTFVLCPRGVRRADWPASDPRFTWGAPDATRAELRAALAALKTQFGPYLAKASVTMAAFELGADRAVEIVREEPKFFSRVALVEGGIEGWTPTVNAIFGNNGGKKLLFVCTTQSCAEPARHRALLARRAGVDAEVLPGAEEAVVLDSRVGSRIQSRWGWLFSPS